MKSLDEIVFLTDKFAVNFNEGSKDTCILTSYALVDVLKRLGYNAYPVRVEAAVFPNDRKLYGAVLGSQGDGSRRPAAGKGMWRGHLAVAIDKDWLLDRTLDQANKPDWPKSCWVAPVIVQLNNAFWDDRSCVFIEFKDEMPISL
jgi:hypothetical protein